MEKILIVILEARDIKSCEVHRLDANVETDRLVELMKTC